MHRNSMDAWLAFKQEAGERMREIMDDIEAHGSGTDRQILQRCKRQDMNEVRPTITRLVRLGYLFEVASVKDAQTGRMVRVVGFRHHGPAIGWPDTQRRSGGIKRRVYGEPGLFGGRA